MVLNLYQISILILINVSAEKDLTAELAEIDAEIATKGATAELYYQRGRLNWRLDRRGAAMSDYERSLALDADSPAKEALKMCRDIMNYYNTDIYNP